RPRLVRVFRIDVVVRRVHSLRPVLAERRGGLRGPRAEGHRLDGVAEVPGFGQELQRDRMGLPLGGDVGVDPHLGHRQITFASARKSAIFLWASPSSSTISPPDFSGAGLMALTSCVGLTASASRPRSETESWSMGFCFACMIPFSVGYRGELAPAVTVTRTGRSASTTS